MLVLVHPVFFHFLKQKIQNLTIKFFCTLKQVSAGQHLHLSGDIKNNNVSMAAQQGVFFNQMQVPPQKHSKAHPNQSSMASGMNSNPNNPQQTQGNIDLNEFI